MSAGEENIEVRQDSPASRFEILVDDVVAGYADYHDSAGVRDFTHTIVATEFGGRGLAGKMVGEALRVTKEEDLRVRPSCSYVAGYVEKHPDEADLV